MGGNERGAASPVERFFNSLRYYGFGSSRVIPGLDGLRAISILFVLLGHLLGTANFPRAPMSLGELALFGVRVFFVVSGYLITSILLRELDRTGTISLRRFYFRRTMRLFPASYAYIGVIAALAAMHVVTLNRWDLLLGVAYVMNYYDGRGWPLGHLWSLAVEEQFYLIWPFTLRALGPERASRFLIWLVALCPLFRMLTPYVHSAFNFIAISDTLAIGCLLALRRDQLHANVHYSRLLRSRWFFLVPVLAIAAVYGPSTKLHWLFFDTLTNVCIALSVDWAMQNPATTVGRFLNAPAVAFIGVLSYSLYLWQQLFLDRYSTSPLCAFPVNVLLAITMAMISYLCIEAPFLRLRAAIERRPAVVATASSND